MVLVPVFRDGKPLFITKGGQTVPAWSEDPCDTRCCEAVVYTSCYDCLFEKTSVNLSLTGYVSGAMTNPPDAPEGMCSMGAINGSYTLAQTSFTDLGSGSAVACYEIYFVSEVDEFGQPEVTCSDRGIEVLYYTDTIIYHNYLYLASISLCLSCGSDGEGGYAVSLIPDLGGDWISLGFYSVTEDIDHNCTGVSPFGPFALSAYGPYTGAPADVTSMSLDDACNNGGEFYISDSDQPFQKPSPSSSWPGAEIDATVSF